jgi:hypothetical protein
MPERMDDRELERTLSDIGERLDYPIRDVWPAVRTRIVERRARPWWSRLGLEQIRLAPVAATLALILVAAFVLTPALVSIAEQVLGLPGAPIFRVPATGSPAPTTGAAPTFAGQRAASLGEATRIAGFTVRAPAALGEPDEIYVESAPVRVTMVYRSRPGLPATTLPGIGALVVEFRGTFDQNVIGKAAGPNTKVEAVQLNGGPGYWLSGQPHQFFFTDPSGNFQPETLRLAGNTLLWQTGGVTYRLEAEVTKEEALRIASTLR